MSFMFEEFSGGYYLGRLFVEPYDGECAAMQRTEHERTNQQLYGADDDPAADNPLVMKLDDTHFPVHGAAEVPSGTLAVPTPLLDQLRVSQPPALREVLLAKADRAEQLLRWFGADPAGETDVYLQ
jgi:hypothetical protein